MVVPFIVASLVGSLITTGRFRDQAERPLRVE